MIIRSFSENDFLAVQNIYQQGIDTGNATFQTEAKSWQQWNSSMLNYCRLVAVEDEKVLGWAGLSAVSSREVYSGVAEVSVYVANQAQGKGLGHALLCELINESESNGIWMLQASIFPENINSIALHARNGFRQVGNREKLGKLNGVWRNVILMERRSAIVGL
ncbi:phosphinothricin acetyltransferase [Pseudoalteromonas sp. 13-15]|uniref:GNAT family N-acetyltransferase n=1 Tax=Pseudoalteromonas TaxID=53246 RepID=UPI0007304832|nr:MULTISPECIES: GNAT family N-acetyltransferase [Pseudoalteromonas]AUL75253.1 phosphinothricin acetyltransferase [Pseudoalteromonas sp. 13-15]WFO20936.1 GNAT family N-acetyltransferase [Pseudoalteromonas sp. H100]SIO22167.1 phosphinothricin acetyltransferase [Pseudoalteromonas marina]